ncbi:MAG TPA: AraC family transcriptional regulator [Dokdonella sp.]|nr:AraC family transcriptional regulator [Dokdonella sp.]
MRIEYERLANGGRLDLGNGEGAKAASSVRVVVGAGRGCVMQGVAQAASVFVPLRGRLQLAEGDNLHTLLPGELLVVEQGQRVQAIGRGGALWVALACGASAWRRCAGADTPADPVLLPALHPAGRALRSKAIELARVASRETEATLALATFAAAMSELQAEFEPLISRCPGRTASQRRNVFLRLQRVRNVMAANCHLDLDIAGFARMASYSPCHFIRTFSTVFGETPHAVLVEQRLRRAHRLINASGLAITEVARVSGFEDRCAFARSFKRRFGITASGLRERGRVAA